jgi:sugar O-acyltransferase (sialic acid O-acetyltransferase NeuD family)
VTAAARRLVVVGAGGFARELLDVVEAINRVGTQQYRIVGAIDGAPTHLGLAQFALRGIPLLGDDDAWLGGDDHADFVVGIGSPSIRRKVAARYESAGRRAATLIHPRATIGSLSSVGAGSVVCAGAQVSTNVRLGRHVHLNPNSTVGHDANVDDFSSINPGAVISGGVLIEERVLVGAGAVVLEQLRLGRESVVGAAACVVRDVAPGATVKGVPAR